MEQTETKRKQVALRLPDGWRGALQIAAARNGRSMNAEIVARLGQTFDSGGLSQAQDRLARDLAEMNQRITRLEEAKR